MITINRIGRHLGAEISGIDLAQPLSDDTFAQVRKAFFDNEVVVFRNQKITHAHQVAFSRRFGELEVHVRKESRVAGHPELLIVSNLLNDQGRAIGVQDAGRFWHSDLSYKAEPSLLSALYAAEVPVTADGRVLGETGFTSTTAAYEALPEDLKQQLQGLKNVHSYRFYRQKNAQAQKEDEARGGRVIEETTPTEEQFKSVPDVDVPIVRTHPVTGRKGLFINEAHTSRIVGLPEDEGQRLLDRLCKHIIKPEFQYQHAWRAGDLLMWDNCSAQHKATFDYDLPLRRLMYRSTVRGTAPV